MKKLIINADDFGLSKLINKGIITAFKKGVLSSASLMANTDGFENAVKLAVRSKLKVGVHLNLTTGKSIIKQTSLTDKNGLFSAYNIPKLLLKEINLQDVKNEFKAQIEKIINYGIIPTHLDGHKHIHIFPSLIKIVVGLAKQFNITKIRLPLQNQTFTQTGFNLKLKSFIVNHYAFRAKEYFKRNHLKYPEHFFGLYETGTLTTEKLKSLIINLKDGTTEIMCHPGYYDPGLSLKLKTERLTELQALTNPIIKVLIKKHNIKLINFSNL